MSIYKRLHSPIAVKHYHLHTIGQMYPYGTFGYKEMGVLTHIFLQRGDINLPDNARVIAISQHNCRGRQWGIVLIQRTETSDWQLVGQFGHGISIPFTRWYISWRYFALIRYGFAFTYAWWASHNHTIDNSIKIESLRTQGVVS